MTCHNRIYAGRALTYSLLFCFFGFIAFGQFITRHVSLEKVMEVREMNSKAVVLNCSSHSKVLTNFFNHHFAIDWLAPETIIDFAGLRIAQSKAFFIRDVSINAFYAFISINAP